jgi:hypothetical protein
VEAGSTVTTLHLPLTTPNKLNDTMIAYLIQQNEQLSEEFCIIRQDVPRQQCLVYYIAIPLQKRF